MDPNQEQQPKSHSLRQKKYRENHPQYREKERLRSKRDRQTKPRDLEKERECSRIRSAKYRAKKQQLAATASLNCDSPFATPRAEKKAIGRALKGLKSVLPHSPRKRARVESAVVTKLSPSFCQSQSSTCQFRQTLKLSEETVALVKEFYEKDDISRMAPGMRDRVIVRSHREKTYTQKRYMCITIREAYQLFCNENPCVKIGKSKFAEFRPQHVLLCSETPQNVCVCISHANFISLLSSLSTYITDLLPYSNSWIKNVVCDENNEACHFNECEVCGDGKMLHQIFLPEDAEELIVDVLLWKKTFNVRLKSDQIVKTKVSQSLRSLYDDFVQKLPGFLKHHFTKRRQVDYVHRIKTLADSSHIVLQIDFAENYVCVYQDEVAGAHWLQSQISLFTSCIWSSKDCLKSYVVASNNLTHDKKAVAAYLVQLINFYFTSHSQLPNSITILSDGPTSQFKNRYIFALLNNLRQHFKLQRLAWSFFASAHGKGPVDGVGGSVKRQVRQSVLSKKVSFVKDAESLCSVVSQMQNNSIKALYSSDTDEAAALQKINAISTFDSAPKINSISEDHYWECTERGTFRNRLSVVSLAHMVDLVDLDDTSVQIIPSTSMTSQSHPSTSDSHPSTSQSHPSTSDVNQIMCQPDDYVLVKFQPTGGNKHVVYYVGHVRRASEDGWEVECMRRNSPTSTQQFRFPSTEDIYVYEQHDIECILNTPKVAKCIYYFTNDLSQYHSYLR